MEELEPPKQMRYQALLNTHKMHEHQLGHIYLIMNLVVKNLVQHADIKSFLQFSLYAQGGSLLEFHLLDWRTG